MDSILLLQWCNIMKISYVLDNTKDILIEDIAASSEKQNNITGGVYSYRDIR